MFMNFACYFSNAGPNMKPSDGMWALKNNCNVTFNLSQVQ